MYEDHLTFPDTENKKRTLSHCPNSQPTSCRALQSSIILTIQPIFRLRCTVMTNVRLTRIFGRRLIRPHSHTPVMSMRTSLLVPV